MLAYTFVYTNVGVETYVCMHVYMQTCAFVHATKGRFMFWEKYMRFL